MEQQILSLTGEFPRKINLKLRKTKINCSKDLEKIQNEVSLKLLNILKDEDKIDAVLKILFKNLDNVPREDLLNLFSDIFTSELCPEVGDKIQESFPEEERDYDAPSYYEKKWDYAPFDMECYNENGQYYINYKQRDSKGFINKWWHPIKIKYMGDDWLC